MPNLERAEQVFVLRLDADDENRFHPDWLDAVEAALDEVEAADGPRALVTVGSGKFWSNGLDLDWLADHGGKLATYLDRVHGLLSRTLSSPVVSIAALNGHTFAAGAMWALAHDMRLMRADRGYFCLPEVDLGLAFTPPMSALIRARLTPQASHEAMTTGRRYGGGDALAAGIVDATHAVDELPDVAIALAGSLAAKTNPTRGEIKELLYAEALAVMRQASDRATPA